VRDSGTLLDDGEEGGGGDAGEVVFRDMILLTLGALFVIAALMFPHLNREAKEAEAAGASAAGNVTVELGWPDGLDADVDLWVQAPGDLPVGYSNKGAAVFNLLRDDLGHQVDLSGRNYEISYARGIVPGEYTVNAHLYRNRSREAQIPLTAVVSVQDGPEGTAHQILMSKADLKRDGQEITVFRFRLDERGGLQAGSVHSAFKPLRSGGKC
jgi:hypothetical protein